MSTPLVRQARDHDPISVARKVYQAYVGGDRAALETLIAADFHFSSPLDNRLDRETYFRRCWPNHEVITGFDFVHLHAEGELVFVTYEGRAARGGFRNTEVLTVRDGQLVEAEVYFGWSLPHKASAGDFLPS